MLEGLTRSNSYTRMGLPGAAAHRPDKRRCADLPVADRRVLRSTNGPPEHPPAKEFEVVGVSYKNYACITA